MHFTSTGFTQDAGCRVFAYEGIGDDKVRIRFTVRADLAMSRKYGIRLQELPLMCLEILERTVKEDEAAGTQQRALTFTEEAMNRYAEECVLARNAASLKRASVRRQPAKADAAPAPFNPYNEGLSAVETPVAKPFRQSW